MRADKWLFHARFFKTRTLATRIVSAGHLRVNGVKIHKPSFGIKVGDALTFLQGDHARVVIIRALAARRGPATEAQDLYEDLSPVKETAPNAPRFDGRGRPGRKDRRNARLYAPTRLD